MTNDGKTLEEIISESVAAALSPDSLKKQVDEHVAKAMNDWLSSALNGWQNPITKAFKSRVQEIFIPAIERMSLDNAKLDVMLGELVSQTAIGERAQILERFGKVVMADIDTDEVAASDVFKRWRQYVAEGIDCDGREICYEEDPPVYEDVECACELVAENRPSWSIMRRATMVMEVQECDGDQAQALNRVIELWRYDDLGDGDLWNVHYPPAPNFKELARMNDFDTYIAGLSIHSTCIRWDLEELTSEYVSPAATPEMTWS